MLWRIITASLSTCNLLTSFYSPMSNVGYFDGELKPDLTVSITSLDGITWSLWNFGGGQQRCDDQKFQPYSGWSQSVIHIVIHPKIDFPTSGRCLKTSRHCTAQFDAKLKKEQHRSAYFTLIHELEIVLSNHTFDGGPQSPSSQKIFKNIPKTWRLIEHSVEKNN